MNLINKSQKIVLIDHSGGYKIDRVEALSVVMSPRKMPETFLPRVLTLNNGDEYVLCRYDLEKDTVFYKRMKHDPTKACT